MSESKLVSATAMALAVEHDPQFRLPKCPRFADGLVVVPMTDGLLIEGTAERQVFRGRAAISLLPHLLPLLDGTRTVVEIAANLPEIPPQAIKNAIALLYTRGVLEDGAADQDTDLIGISPELMAFFRRHVDTTRVNRSANEALTRLLSVRLAIVGQEKHADLLAAELGYCGLANVSTWDPPIEVLNETVDLLVVLLHAGENRSDLAQIDKLCATSHIRWLRSSLDGSRVEIGPYFERGETPCYSCFEAVYDWSSPVRPITPAHEQAWISLVATEVIYLASRICPPITGRNMVQFDFSDWSQTRLRLPKLPGCPSCCPIPGRGRNRQVELAVAYEQAVASPSKEFLNPKEHQLHYLASNLELQRDQKRYPSAHCEPLPPPDETPVPEASYLSRLFTEGSVLRAGLDRATLSGLLLRGGGLREEDGAVDDKVQRWAPTSGNLGSVQIYVLARRVKGLRCGCYFYQPREHVLASLRPEQTESEFDELTKEVVGDVLDADFDALLVLSAAYDRVKLKYGALAYRLIHLDAGVAIAQLQAVANAYGLQLQPANRWNDQLLLKELDLIGESTPITATVAVYHKPPV